MLDLPKLGSTKIEIVGACVGLQSLGRPQEEPWTCLQDSRIDLGPRARIDLVLVWRFSLYGLETQGIWVFRRLIQVWTRFGSMRVRAHHVLGFGLSAFKYWVSLGSFWARI